jgi:hypothetical protein
MICLYNILGISISLYYFNKQWLEIFVGHCTNFKTIIIVPFPI